MKLNEYQTLAMRTENGSPLEILGLGITGEAGEVADEIKKHVGHGHELDRAKIENELGDVLWYVATLATKIGKTLEEVADTNVEKLKARYPDGFSTERSVNRGVLGFFDLDGDETEIRAVSAIRYEWRAQTGGRWSPWWRSFLSEVDDSGDMHYAQRDEIKALCEGFK